MQKNRSAPCGLDCAACGLYRATHDLAAAASLVDWFRSRGWIGLADGPEAVQAKAPFCMGCLTAEEPRWCGDCFMRECTAGKSLADCGLCADFPCARYLAWTVNTPHHQAAMEHLLRRGKEDPRV